MSEKFELLPSLQKKQYIMDLEFCVVLLENNKLYPWVFLVPKKNGIKNMTFLSLEERFKLMKEIAIVENAMLNSFSCDQTNVAMIGNKTPQLHVHIICRKDGDADWPKTVWDNSTEPYTETEIKATIEKIKNGIQNEMNKADYK